MSRSPTGRSSKKKSDDLLSSVGGKKARYHLPPKNATEFAWNFVFMSKFGLEEDLKAILKAARTQELPFGLNVHMLVTYQLDRETALVLAGKYGQQSVCALLIKAGADVNHRAINNGSVCLWSTRSYNLDNFIDREPFLAPTLTFLVKCGADINAQNDYGETPLHWAFGRGSKVLIMTLIGLGADPSLRTTNNGYINMSAGEHINVAKGKLPEDWALAAGMTDVFEWWEEWKTTVNKSKKEKTNPQHPDVMISINVKTMGSQAGKLKQFLQSKGLSTWLCTDLQTGSNFRNEIVVAATASKVFMPLINEEWAKSKECAWEAQIALRNELTVNKPVMVPIIAEEFDFRKYPIVFGIMANTNAIFLTDPSKNQQTFPKLISSLAEAGVVVGKGGSSEAQNDPAEEEDTKKDGMMESTYVFPVDEKMNFTGPGTIMSCEDVNTLPELRDRVVTKFPSLKGGEYDLFFKEMWDGLEMNVKISSEFDCAEWAKRVKKGLKPVLLYRLYA